MFIYNIKIDAFMRYLYQRNIIIIHIEHSD
jgi:hypothetical protein